MTPPTYTPYDGSAKPFTIGLMPLDPDCWIEPDADWARYVGEKRALVEIRRDDVFVAEADTSDAQREALDLLRQHLRERHPNLCPDVPDTDSDLPPLLRAGLMIQDDLVIMRRKQDGWHLVAGFVAFPSSWSLREKFGRPMHAIHADVPGFGEGTRNATLIHRIFDNLQVSQPVERLNWSVNTSNALFLPLSKHRRPPQAAVHAGRSLRPRRAPDAAQAPSVGRYPLHDPRLRRSDLRYCPSPAGAKPGTKLRSPARKPRRAPGGVQGTEPA